MVLISSKANEKIKYAKTVRDDPATRKKDGACLAEGLRLCSEALKAGVARIFFMTERFALKHPLFAESVPGETEVFLVSEAIADLLSGTGEPQGVFCVCDIQKLRGDAETLDAAGGNIICLDRISDPGNMGTILRAAEAFGARRLLLGGNSCDLFSPKVLRASMGACFRLKAYWSAGLDEQVRRLSRAGVRFYAAMPDMGACDIRTLKPETPFAVVIGNEADGVSAGVARHCTPVCIPMAGGAESLNAASAASIFLWELFGKGASEEK